MVIFVVMRHDQGDNLIDIPPKQEQGNSPGDSTINHNSAASAKQNDIARPLPNVQEVAFGNTLLVAQVSVQSRSEAGKELVVGSDCQNRFSSPSAIG